ncbi:glycosyltransferase family 2 protein [Salegentibacter flavus]|uniref:Glycosyltransferase, GT2 family n=1 Tax=Salegentibacter flavus TaxID=287099 RepID=A0A1I5BPT3_9FLAO|nr:glycosyltransferase family 2 protein [Salegentibacter flavus]SFN76461.1 Glycosyltransferase, GT2 family [Salegentibacter flavus]
MQNLKITSIIITFNGEQWITKCLSSLINSSIKTEIIVIDNGSNDQTKEIIEKSFPNVQLLVSGVNLGFGKANNMGFAKALEMNSDYVFLLNQDAWVEMDTIKKLVEVHQRNPEFGILSPIHKSGGSEIDQNFLKYLGPKFTPILLSDFLLDRNLKEVYPTHFVNAAIWLLPKTTIQKVGGFLNIFNHYGEDDNYIDRCIYHHFKIGIVPKALGVHDRPQKNNNPGNFSKSKFQNYVFSHLLTLILNPNVNKKRKLTPISFLLLKNFYRKPYPTTIAAFLILRKLRVIKEQYKTSKLLK